MKLEYSDFLGMGGQQMDIMLFERLSYKAESILNELTFDRLKGDDTLRQGVSYALFELVNMLVSDLSSEGRNVSSVSNDGVSVTYGDGGKSSAHRYFSAIRPYLINEVAKDGTPLLFRGVDYL